MILRRRRRRPVPWHIDWLSLPFTCLLILISFPLPSHQASTLGKRDLDQLSSSQISALVSYPDPFKNLDPSDPNSHLSKILIPRAPDTDNNTLVRKYISSTLSALSWHIEEDTFTALTPIGTKRFTNIIATKDPLASRRVVLSAHFDSKYYANYPMNQFVGATDSAVPCALMLDLAEALNPLLDARKDRLEEGLEDDEDVSDTTLQLVFFDGEEAFHEWTDTDSIYGAKHLAETWSTTYLPPHPKRRLVSTTNLIAPVEHLILLDLLGAPSPRVRSYFLDTAWLFDGMVLAESRLHQAGFINELDEQGLQKPWSSFFNARSAVDINFGWIGDDHEPFLKKGVSVLHIITQPFPRVWHTLQDDASALDLPTMHRWNLILRVFMSEYLNLRPEVKNPPIPQRSVSELVSEIL